ncbi:MAG TPA: pantoate--beta-alanine ligase [Opitutaceae bacterium]|nr:pantoate--beta-alanine ligase [Opitutaceae bacterium]
MKKLETVGEMQLAAEELRAQGKTIALVPTSGALHDGHVALIRAAKAKAGAVIVSLFVNPLQFGPSENYAGYPRTPEADLAKCAELEVDLVFAPNVEAMYPRGFSTYVVEEAVSKPLCGISRPTHFRGVTTVLAKLFNIVRPHFVVFGQKEAQQSAVARKLIADLHFGVEVVVVPTVREAGGLACDVRNRNLTANQRTEALSLPASLKRAQEMAASGVRSADRIMAEVTHILSQHRRVRVIYVSIVDPTTMEAMREVVPGRSLLVIAAWVDEVRLTDNAPL